VPYDPSIKWGINRPSQNYIVSNAEQVYDNYMPQPMVFPGQSKKRGGEEMKAKRTSLNERARRQEAKFWVMMRAAEPGKRCLK
jgi:hypothetical protein